MNQKGSVLILHSSVTRQVEILSLSMVQAFEHEGFDVKLSSDFSQFTPEDLTRFDLICIGTEHGDKRFKYESNLFAHPNLVLFASSRKSLFHLRKRADKLSARILNLALFPVRRGRGYPVLSWLNSVIHKDAGSDYPGFQMDPYGIPEEELERAQVFAQNIVQQLRLQQAAVLA